MVKKIHTLTRGARKHRDFRYQVATLMDEIGLGRARDLGCNGRYDEAVTELQQYITTNPELRLRLTEAPQRFCADILDDQPREFQGVELGDNSGSIRTVKQLKDQALKNAIKLRLGKASAINGVANSLEDYDGAYLLLDQGLTDEDKYFELSHELDTWISNGAFLQPLRGDWRQMRKADNQFVDEEGTVRHANLEMDEYFAGTMGWRDPN